MGKAFIAVIGIALFVYTVYDLIATPRQRVRILPKALWFVALLFVPVGPLLWLFFGRIKPSAPPTRGNQSKPSPPPGPRGPDDDPDYLRGL